MTRAGKSAMEDGAWAKAAADGYPDPLMALETRAPSGVSCGTRRVLFDLDGLRWEHTLWGSLQPLVEAVIRGSPLFSRVVSVVETSSHGVQVVARLERHRWDARGFYRDPGVRDELERVGAALVALVGRGGHADPSAWSPGRHARQPGPRERQGLVECARLVWAASDTVTLADGVGVAVAAA